MRADAKKRIYKTNGSLRSPSTNNHTNMDTKWTEPHLTCDSQNIKIKTYSKNKTIALACDTIFQCIF